MRRIAFAGNGFPVGDFRSINIPRDNDIKSSSQTTESPLLKTNDPKIRKWLLEVGGASPNYRSGNGPSPLVYAAREGDIALCELYFKYGGDAKIEVGTPVYTVLDIIMNKILNSPDEDLEKNLYDIYVLFESKGATHKHYSNSDGGKSIKSIFRNRGVEVE